ncbi:MAG: hypothetical protein SVV03_00625, partial [Candidatus Nanohaloarchaea archaeon]|nr:hypothetical protein [Candidatus Nanohaloarchaea archaeon]
MLGMRQRSRKGLNFGIVLIIGIAIFVVGGLLAGITDTPDLGTGGSGEDKEGALLSKNVGWIGEISTTSRTPLQLDKVNAGSTDPNQTVESFEKIEIRNSVLGSDNFVTAKFETREPKALYLKFTVADANPSGKMIFNLNGNVEKKRELQPGKSYTIKLSNMSKGKNTLLLAAESPGLMFWSTALYDLRDVELVLNDRSFSRNTKTFRLFPYEVEGFDQGELSFSVHEDVEARDPLVVDINGRTVMERSAVKRPEPYSKKFSASETDLRPGENTVSFYTRPGSDYTLSNVNINLDYYATTSRNVVSESFDLPFFDYRLIDSDDRGTMTLDVDKIGLEKPVKVSLNNKTWNRMLEGGENTFEFRGGSLLEGENTVELVTTGSYKISRLEVKLE